MSKEEIVRVAKNYRITIPKSIRNEEDINEGDFVIIKVYKANITMKGTWRVKSISEISSYNRKKGEE